MEKVLNEIGARLHLSTQGTGIPRTNKGAHAMVVSIQTYPLVRSKLPVYESRFKANASIYFIEKLSQI